MKKVFVPKGTCADRIEFHLEEGKVRSLRFHSGCDGNLQAIGLLAEGMEAAQVIRLLKGVRCGRKSTSCADQLARAVEEALGAS